MNAATSFATHSSGLEPRDPRTGRADPRIDISDRTEIAHVTARLRQAQPQWARRTLEERYVALDAFCAAIDRHRASLLGALVRDTGRLGASMMEVDAARALVARWRNAAPQSLATIENSAEAPGVRAWGHRIPYPLVGIITPWNSPLGLTLIDALPALIAGCAVIAKPSEVTPRFIAPLMAAIADVPDLAAVFAVVVGDGATGTAIVEESDALCFTGSVETGRFVAEAAARRLIPVSLELGGKDPAVVLEGADLDRAADRIFWSATFNTGQLCHSIERIYVARPIAEPLVTRLVARAEAAKLGWPELTLDGLGPFIDPRQATIVERHLADARAHGAVIRSGGRIEHYGGGSWCLPTVLTGVTHDMLVMTEETFGPLMPVMAFDTVDQAIQLANDSRYGLSASVWGPETEALAVGRRINAGGVSINDASLSSVVQTVEKNAFGASGVGPSRMGEAGIRRFLRHQALLVRQPVKENAG